MFKIAFWISLVLLVTSLVVIAPLLNPAWAAEAGDAQPDPAQQQAARDEIIATRIDAAYLREHRLKPYYIEVRVESGVVTLKGTVATERDRELAVLIANDQQYVREVRDQIEVREAGLIHTSAVAMDAGGAAHAQASTEDAAPTQPEPEAEPDEAGAGQGGLGAMLSNAGLVAKVKTRLLVHFGMTGLRINVDASDRVVRLTGTLKDPELVPMIERVASSTPGVQQVQNELRVEMATSSAEREHPDRYLLTLTEPDDAASI